MNSEMCCVCALPLDDVNRGVCNGCGLPFHLRVQGDLQGPECGQVWVHPQYLALEYGCLICLGHAPGREPPVGPSH